MIRRLVTSAELALLCCGAPAAAQEKIKVVASFSILGDLVRNVGGDRVEVADLVGRNKPDLPTFGANRCTIASTSS